jgi:hypothetical protein
MRMASILGSSPNIFMNAENSVAAPSSHCHCPGKELVLESKHREPNPEAAI